MKKSNKSRPKFRLISLFTLITVISFFLAAHESHRRGNAKLENIDHSVEATIDEISDEIYETSVKQFEQLNASRPQLLATFRTNHPTKPYASLTAFSDTGNSRSQCRGGLFDGPAEIERQIVLGGYIPPSLLADGILFVRDQKVRINVACRVPWRVFAGKPTVHIIVFKGPLNEQFVQSLTRRLTKQKVSFTIETASEP